LQEAEGTKEMVEESIHEIGMKAALGAVKASGTNEERIHRAIAACLKAKNEVLVERPMLSRLYQFFHHARVGHGEGCDESTFARDLRDWRDELYAYHLRDFRAE
jgi:hypothetical protein